MSKKLLTDNILYQISIIKRIFFFLFYCLSKKLFGVKYTNIYKNNKINQITKFIQNKYPNDYCIFSRDGIGDIFFIAGLIREFKKGKEGRVIYFTDKLSCVPLIKAFKSIDEVYYNRALGAFQEFKTLQKDLVKGQLNILFFPYKGTKPTYTFSDNYNNLLNLPLNTERELPAISLENMEKAENEFKRFEVSKEKTILIIPDATMFDYRIIDSKFWISLAKELEARGFDIVFNTKLNKYKNFKNTFLPIMDFIAFSKQVKHVISFRSGINDLFAGVGITNMTVVYPPNLEVMWADADEVHKLHEHHTFTSGNELENIFNIHSLNRTFNSSNINEFLYNFNDNEIIDTIIRNI